MPNSALFRTVVQRCGQAHPKIVEFEQRRDKRRVGLHRRLVQRLPRGAVFVRVRQNCAEERVERFFAR